MIADLTPLTNFQLYLIEQKFHFQTIFTRLCPNEVKVVYLFTIYKLICRLQRTKTIYQSNEVILEESFARSNKCGLNEITRDYITTQ